MTNMRRDMAKSTHHSMAAISGQTVSSSLLKGVNNPSRQSCSGTRHSTDQVEQQTGLTHKEIQAIFGIRLSSQNRGVFEPLSCLMIMCLNKQLQDLTWSLVKLWYFTIWSKTKKNIFKSHEFSPTLRFSKAPESPRPRSHRHSPPFRAPPFRPLRRQRWLQLRCRLQRPDTSDKTRLRSSAGKRLGRQANLHQGW